MKTTFGLWTFLFIVGWMTAGFIPAIFLTIIAGVSAVSLSLHAQNNALGSGSSYKSLR